MTARSFRKAMLGKQPLNYNRCLHSFIVSVNLYVTCPTGAVQTLKNFSYRKGNGYAVSAAEMALKEVSVSSEIDGAALNW